MQITPALAADFLREQGIGETSTAVILGTGLHRLGKAIRVELSVPYASIPGFCLSTVESHPGNLLYGQAGNKKVIALQGRFHLYEGYSIDQITFPVRVLHCLGVKNLFISNAAGALNPEFRKGELMQITSHIDFQDNPMQTLTPASCYNTGLGRIFEQAATLRGIPLRKGTYAAVTGPQLETRAEYRYLRKLGADAVGMSTVPEVLTATGLGMNCLAVSVLTDECDPDNLHPVTLEEIIAVASGADEILTQLFYTSIESC